MEKPALLLGAHMSIAGGFDQAIIRGESIGCTAIQIFTKSNRQWRARPISDEESIQFKRAWATLSIRSVMAHASYLINIGSPDPTVHAASVQALAHELERCALLTIPYLIIHPGSRGTGNEQECLERIALTLDDIFKKDKGTTMILLENMAGQGTSAAHTFQSLAYIRSQTNHKSRLGFCFDTCHAFAAGYNFQTDSSYETLWQDFDAIIGLEHLKAFHINDSKKPFASRVDRHEDIGKGLIGLESFRRLFNDPRFFAIPKILETPRDTLEDYALNMAVLKDLISDKTRNLLKI